MTRTGTWLTQAADGASGGTYLYSTGSEADVLTLVFSGTTIEIVYLAGPHLGTLALEVDDTVLRTVITTADQTAYQQTATLNYLTDEPHTLRVYAQEGDVVAVDAFVARLPAEDSLIAGTRVVVPPDDPAYQITYDYGSPPDVFLAYTTATPLQLTATGDKYSPVWSPTGIRIAYVTNRQPSGEPAFGMIERNNQGQWTDRGVFAYLTNDYSIFGKIAWSPDGTRIAYAASNPDGNVALYYLDLTNCTLVNNFPTQCASVAITQFSYGIHDYNPSWSPDGTRIVFDTNRDGCCKTHLYTIRPDGTNLTRISYAGYTGGELPGASEILRDPEWSPNGTQLTVVWHGRLAPGDTAPRAGDIAIINADGTNLTRLTDTPEPESSPTWSPDGSQIAYARGSWASAQLYRLNVATLQTTLQGAGRNPRWRRQTTSDFCIVEVYTRPNTLPANVVNGYAHPVYARTVRFEGDPSNPVANTQAAPTPTAFNSGTYLRLEHRYDRFGAEASIYEVTAYSTDDGVTYTDLTSNLWISSHGLRVNDPNFLNNYSPAVEVRQNDCAQLQTLNPAAPSNAETVIEEIRDYGVDVREDGCGTRWSLTQLQALRDGLVATSSALRLVGVRASNSTMLDSERFKIVMLRRIGTGQDDVPDYILFVMLTGTNPCATSIYDNYYGVNHYAGRTVACLTNLGTNVPNVAFTDASPAVVACIAGTFQFRDTTAVHELGHIFDDRIRSTTFPNQITNPGGYLHDRVQYNMTGYGYGSETNILRDCGFVPDPNNPTQPLLVSNAPIRIQTVLANPSTNTYGVTAGDIGRIMGQTTTGWIRGLQGWGTYSTSSTNITEFQQNPASTPEEAAADMFLNWVFRRYTGTAPTSNPDDACTAPQTGNWRGFQNTNANNQADYNLSGNRRYWWMEAQMDDIISDLGWG